MKRAISIIAIFVLLLLSLTLLSSCVNEDSQNKINNATTEPVVTLNEEKPSTGFPSGQLQKEYIFYGGVVWTYDMYNTAEQKLKELPKDFTFIGQTLLEDPYVMPSEDFHTAHIEPGKDVYISPEGDAIYIELKKGIYCRYIPKKSIYPTPPETTLPSETTEPEPDDNIVYTAEYYAGSYKGYDFVNYEDEERGEAYKKAYPNKHFNDNVTIELEITAKLEQTTYSAGDKFWIDFKATNAGEPFMYIDWEVNYFDSWLVNTEHVTEAGTNFEFHNDYYADGRPSLDAGPYEDLFEKGETRVDANPYTVTADIPTGKYDLYIYFGGFTFVVRDALEITSEWIAVETPGTGYPDGQMQREYIFYDGVVWELDVYDPDIRHTREVPEDFIFIGQTLYENPYEIPSENFYTTHIAPGKNVYITVSGEAIYIEFRRCEYRKLIPAAIIDTSDQ